MKERATLRWILEIGGIVAGVIMVAFGVAAIYMGFDGRSTVQSNLGNEFIVGSDDMNTDDITTEINEHHPARPEADRSRAREGRRRPDRVHTGRGAELLRGGTRRSTTAPMRGASPSTSVSTRCARRAV